MIQVIFHILVFEHATLFEIFSFSFECCKWPRGKNFCFEAFFLFLQNNKNKQVKSRVGKIKRKQISQPLWCKAVLEDLSSPVQALTFAQPSFSLTVWLGEPICVFCKRVKRSHDQNSENTTNLATQNWILHKTCIYTVQFDVHQTCLMLYCLAFWSNLQVQFWVKDFRISSWQ